MYLGKGTLHRNIKRKSSDKVINREAGLSPGNPKSSVKVYNQQRSWSLLRKSHVSAFQCLCPLISADGWQITTIEGLGSEKEGYHPIQKRIASFSGTQCGYCTPGMVMSTTALLERHPHPTPREVGIGLSGNLCRCTGYANIIAAVIKTAEDSNG